MLNYILNTNAKAGMPKIKYYETYKVAYNLTLGFIILGLIIHCISAYHSNNYFPALIDCITLVLFTISYILKISNVITQKSAYSFLLYAMLLNVCISDIYIQRVEVSSTLTYFLYSFLFVLILNILIGLLVDIKHILIMGSISIVRIWCFTFYIDNPLLWSVFISIHVIFVGLIIGLCLIMKTMKDNMLEYHAENQTLLNQNIELNKLMGFKDDMLNMILHDIKNPINLILAAGNDNTIKKSEIAESGKRILLIAENILDISKMKESKMKLNLENVNFNNVVYDALAEVDYLLKQKKILVIRGFSDNPVLRIDENLIKRLMVNLLTNAIKSSKVNEHIEIKLLKEDGILRVEVIDKGIGISPEFINKVFDKFYQEKINDSIYNRSVGLGLTFCKLVVDTHNGKIGAESVLNNGTTMWFEFPMVLNSVKMIEKTCESTDEIIEFNTDESKFLLFYKKKLAILDIYQTGEMYRMLYTYKCGESKQLIHWKDEIINASLTGNIEIYEKLRKIGS